MEEYLDDFRERYQDMKDWPNTPSAGRLRDAFLAMEISHYNGLSPQVDDVKRVLKDAVILKERSDSLKSFQLPALQDTAKFDRDMDNSTRTKKLLTITERGNTDETIGLIVNIRVIDDITSDSTKSEPDGKDPFYASLFARLPRDPDWMGWDRILKTAAGMRALVLEAHIESGKPGIVVMSPPKQFQGFSETNKEPFPEGEAQILRDLLKWHGADPWWRNDQS